MNLRHIVKNNQQKIRFGVVGIGNTAIDFGLYAAFSYFGHMPLILANFLSTSAGFVMSFFLNRSFTFDSRNNHKLHEFIRFLITTLVGLWALQPVIIYMSRAMLQGTPLTGIALVALPKLTAIAVGLIWNYLWYSRFVFVERESSLATVLERLRNLVVRRAN